MTVPDRWVPTHAGAHLRGRSTSGTKPELALRRAMHALGLRYRLQRRIGHFRPDVVFPGPRVVVFVDGCFWHRCPEHGPVAFKGPNAHRWQAKIGRNVSRDLDATAELTAEGWRVVRVWECEVRRDATGAAAAVRRVVQTATDD